MPGEAPGITTPKGSTMNHELARRYRNGNAQAMTEYRPRAVGMIATDAEPRGLRDLRGEAVTVEGHYRSSEGQLWLEVGVRVPITSERMDAGMTVIVKVPAGQVLTVVPNARVGACPDLLCPNDTARVGEDGQIVKPPLTCCWTVRHEDGTVSHGWANGADCAAAAHTYPTAPADLLLPERHARMVVETGWTVGAGL